MMRPPAASHPAKDVRTPRASARFGADRRGATAVEFAIVALPFFFMIFAVIELAAVFLVNVSLENATAAAARALRTGNIVAAGVANTTSTGIYEDATDFRNSICAGMGWIPAATCQKQLYVDVRAYSSFENQSQMNPISGTTFNTQNLCYYSGNSSSNASTTNTIILVRTYYLWPLMTPFLMGGLQNVTTVTNGVSTIVSGQHLSAVEAAEVFKNEPYPAANTDTGTC